MKYFDLITMYILIYKKKIILYFNYITSFCFIASPIVSFSPRREFRLDIKIFILRAQSLKQDRLSVFADNYENAIQIIIRKKNNGVF